MILQIFARSGILRPILEVALIICQPNGGAVVPASCGGFNAGAPLRADPGWSHLPGRGTRRAGSPGPGAGPTLEGSFSAVSKPNFASNYAFESSRRDLHNALLCTALKITFLAKKCNDVAIFFLKK